MARGCGCAGSTCGCNLEAGPGIDIEGIGTAASPFRIQALVNAVDDSVLVIQAGPGVSITDTGLGTPTDPRTITVSSVPTTVATSASLGTGEYVGHRKFIAGGTYANQWGTWNGTGWYRYDGTLIA